LVGPELLCHEFIHDNDWGFLRCIVVIKVTSLDQWNLHGLKIIAVDDALIGIDKFFSRQRHTSFHDYWAPSQHGAQGQGRNGAHAAHARQMLQVF
jgi:hypothetical protein